MKILIVQTSFIGDLILSTPVIAGLKKIHPDSHLTIMTTPIGSSLIKNDPLLNEIIVFDKRSKEKGFLGLIKKAKDLRKKKIDIVYSLHRSYRTSLLLYLAKIPTRIGFSDSKFNFLYTQKVHRTMAEHAVISNLSILFSQEDRSSLNTNLRLFAPNRKNLNPETKKTISSLSKPYAVLAPGSAWKTKQWHASGFFDVALFLKRNGLEVVLIGGPADRNVCKQINQGLNITDLSGNIPLSDTLYILKNSRLLICNDSMSLHMGSAFKTPTVVIFCATSPSFGFSPWKNPNAIIVEEASLDCKPCSRHGSLSCPNHTNACMKVASQRVIRACRKLMGLN